MEPSRRGAALSAGEQEACQGGAGDSRSRLAARECGGQGGRGHLAVARPAREFRYGLRDAALRIFDGLFAASTHIDLRRLPELFCGFERRRNPGPTLYPVACIPQAWAAAAPLSLLQSCLNLGFDVGARKISFHYPALPSFMEDATLKGLSLADATVDVMLRRANASVVVNVMARTGDVLVTTTN